MMVLVILVFVVGCLVLDKVICEENPHWVGDLDFVGRGNVCRYCVDFLACGGYKKKKFK